MLLSRSAAGKREIERAGPMSVSPEYEVPDSAYPRDVTSPGPDQKRGAAKAQRAPSTSTTSAASGRKNGDEAKKTPQKE